MIDQNALIEIVNNAMPIAASSPVLIKLIQSVESVIKTLYEPALTFKNGKAEVDVDMYRKQKEQEFLGNQTFTLYEITKLKNFVNSARFAAEELQMNKDQSTTYENVDFDWIMRFFDAVGNVSNEELQKLWGKVLAGEIRQPLTCSLRTLDIIHNMTQKEAEIYNKLCKFVLISGDCYFIFHNGFCESNGYNEDSKNYIARTGLTYSDSIIPMIECGLLSIDNDIATDFKTNNVLCIQNQEIACFVVADETRDNFMQIESYTLTKSGIELYNIICNMHDFNSNNQYSMFCFKEFKNMYPDLTISAHKIIGIDDFDPNDLLEEE